MSEVFWKPRVPLRNDVFQKSKIGTDRDAKNTREGMRVLNDGCQKNFA